MWSEQLMSAAMPEEHPAAVGAAAAIGLAKDLGVIEFGHDALFGPAGALWRLVRPALGRKPRQRRRGHDPHWRRSGPVDQHSQLQLFMDGPRVHFMTVLRVTGRSGRVTPAIPAALAAEAGAAYLAGRTIGDLVRRAKAIVDALAEAKRPVRTIDMDRLDEARLAR